MNSIQVIIVPPGEAAYASTYIDFEHVKRNMFGDACVLGFTAHFPKLYRKGVRYEYYENNEYSEKKIQPNRAVYNEDDSLYDVLYGKAIVLKYFKNKLTSLDFEECTYILKHLNSVKCDPWMDIRNEIASRKVEEDKE